MAWSQAIDAANMMAEDICESERVRTTVNEVGPKVAGLATMSVAGHPAGLAVECGLERLRAVDERACAKGLTSTGLGMALPLLTPVAVVMFAWAIVDDIVTGAKSRAC